MARRLPFTDPHGAINCLREDGGVILTGFAESDDVRAVNHDAAPYIDAVAKEASISSNVTMLRMLTETA